MTQGSTFCTMSQKKKTTITPSADDPYNPDPEFFKGFFIYYYDSYRRLRTKRDKPQRRFAVYRVLSSVS